jgi:Antirepressor regulating drug resistance, predicted signal transduction N-terminal membrane component
MGFSPSTLCTHLVICVLSLLALRFLVLKPSRIGRLGFSTIIICSMLIALRLLLPFEWKLTKTIPVEGIYLYVISFLNQNLICLGSFELSVFHLLAMIAISVSVIRMGYLVFAQRKYIRYLNSLPNATYLRYTNRFGISSVVSCVADPKATNALVVGIIHPRIVMPNIQLADEEKQLILNHELSHILSGDLWIKLLVEIVCTTYWWIPFIGILRQQMTAALEFRADHRTTATLSETERLTYLECLLKVTKAKHQETIPLTVGLTSYKVDSLENRFKFILSPPKKSSLYRVLALLFVVIMVASTFIVFEPYGAPSVVQSESFILDVGNSYFVQREEGGFDLYIEGEYLGLVNVIPIELSHFPIIK